jgi:hypothetical protein
MRISMMLAAAAAFLPIVAAAQGQSDVAYCRQLAGTYEHYIGRSEKSAYEDVRRGSLDAQVAATQCQSRTAEAIQVLELRLRNGKVSLPPRG